MKIKKVVPWEADGIRLDRFLSTLFPETHISTLRWLIRDGRVLVDGRLTLRQLNLRPNTLVEVKIPEGEELRARKVPRARAPEVLYADEACLVVDKPAGVPVIPERFREVETLRDLMEGGEKLRIVHRLDRDTSGCLLLARNREAQRALSQQFRERGIEKVYLALVRGRFPEGKTMDVERAIGPDMRSRGRMRVVPAEEIEKHPRRPHKEAFTRLEGKEQFRGYALVEARPRTGRTHQVRVHLASIGLPLVGDRIYAAGVDRGLFLSEF
ncbi:MAG TPA: RluA family pseudouridine synthase, partial [Planctomycetes bacterium]|nr:RluA family pseudouridine synthase [Planctomycetota bacterium]